MKYLLIVFSVIFISSCQTDEGENIIKDFTEQNENEIINYINDNNLDAQKSNSGLYYVIQQQGDGARPTVNSNVTVIYKGYYTNGNIFDESDGEGITFNLQQVIAGWTEGITYFKEGGKGLLLVPSRLAYGSSDTRGIPGGSVLIFEIELSEVK
jgi:FKBP-type peptidyl-prolyl cis-trans isomerase FkpA